MAVVRARVVAVVLPLMLAVVSASCGPSVDEGGGGEDRSGGASTVVTGSITVLAAASLTTAFTDLAHDFEQRHPGASVTISFGPSSGLARTIVQGAPADVFATADPDWLDPVTDEGLAVAEPAVFARNTLRIAVPSNNPAQVRGITDLANDQLLVAVCAPEVPCGEAAERVFQLTDVSVEPDTFGRDVRSVLTLVRTGEVDAGLVYQTDVQDASAEVEGIDIPEAADAANDYAILALDENPTARAFVDYVLDEPGRQILRKAGFELP